MKAATDVQLLVWPLAGTASSPAVNDFTVTVDGGSVINVTGSANTACQRHGHRRLFTQRLRSFVRVITVRTSADQGKAAVTLENVNWKIRDTCTNVNASTGTVEVMSAFSTGSTTGSLNCTWSADGNTVGITSATKLYYAFGGVKRSFSR